MAMRKPGPYAPLSAHYADDEKIMAAGEDAELLYIRMLAYAARTPMTEGWISDAVIHSRLGILARPAGNGAGNEAGTDAGSRAEKLREVGLIERERSGYRITSWLKWNRSIEEMGRERARDANRKTAPTSGNDGTGTGTDAGNDAGVPHASPLADQNTDQKQISGRRKRPATTLPEDWQPNDSHRQFAAEHRIDIDRELFKFRNHAAQSDRRAVRWDAAFTNWLDKARDYAPAQPKRHQERTDLPEAWR